MKYPYVFFDLDNTLLDFNKGQDWAFKESVTEIYGKFEPRWLSKYVEINSALWRRFERGKIDQKTVKTDRFRLFVENVGIAVDPIELSELFLSRLSSTTFEIDGAEETLRILSSRQHRLVLITNGLSQVQRPRLAASRLTQYFEGIIISDEVGIAKPAPEIFQMAMEIVGNPPKAEVLMIGDSFSSDIQGGINFGIDTCWFNLFDDAIRPEFDVTHVATNLNQITELV